MRTKSGVILGAALIKGFSKGSENKYLADREAVLFNLTTLKSYQWNFGSPDYVSYWSQDRVVIGCDLEGNNALVLEQELEHVHLGKCGVFRAPPLHQEEDGGLKPDLSALEIYKFA